MVRLHARHPQLFDRRPHPLRHRRLVARGRKQPPSIGEIEQQPHHQRRSETFFGRIDTSFDQVAHPCAGDVDGVTKRGSANCPPSAMRSPPVGRSRCGTKTIYSASPGCGIAGKLLDELIHRSFIPRQTAEGGMHSAEEAGETRWSSAIVSPRLTLSTHMAQTAYFWSAFWRGCRPKIQREGATWTTARSATSRPPRWHRQAHVLTGPNVVVVLRRRSNNGKELHLRSAQFAPPAFDSLRPLRPGRWKPALV